MLDITLRLLDVRLEVQLTYFKTEVCQTQIDPSLTSNQIPAWIASRKGPIVAQIQAQEF